MAKKRAYRLKRIFDVSDYLANLINRLERDEIEESKAGKLGYLVNLLKGALEAGDIEQRLASLENRLNGKEAKGAWQSGEADRAA